MVRFTTVALSRLFSSFCRIAVFLLILACLAFVPASQAQAQSNSVPVLIPIFSYSGSLGVYWKGAANAISYNVYRGTIAGGEGTTPIVTGVTNFNGNAYEYSDTGVTNGTTYYYKITAVTFNGESGFSNEYSATPGVTPLPGPNLIGTVGNEQVVLKWSTIPGATNYVLYRLNSNNQYVAYQIGLTSTSYTDTALTNGSAYTYYVEAVDKDGTGSNSNFLSVTSGETLPPAPTNVHSETLSDPSVLAVAWNVSPGASSYNVYRGTSSGGESTTPIAVNYTDEYDYGIKVYQDTSAVVGMTYYYYVTAVNNVGESVHSNEVSGLLNAANGTPPALTATASSSPAKVTLTWNAIVGATGYDIYKRIDRDGTYTLLTSTTSTTATDTAVIPGVAYDYYVTYDVGKSDESTASNTVIITPGGALPPAPTGVAVSATLSEIILTWNTVLGATGYNIYRGTSSNGEGAIPYASNVLSSPYYDDNVNVGTTYYYFVTTINNNGESSHSSQVSANPNATTLASPVLTIASNASSQPILTWSAVPGAANYAVYSSLDGFTYLEIVQQTALTYTDTTAALGTPINYHVTAMSSSGGSQSSNTVTFTPGQPAPPAPTGLTAGPNPSASSQVTLTWNPVPGASSYNVYQGTSAGGEAAVPVLTGATNPNSTIVSGLTSGTRYYFEVTAVSNAGESAKSNEVSAKPNAAVLPAPSLTASSPSATEIDLKWTAISGTTGYSVYRSVGATSSYTLLATATTSSYKDMGLKTGLVYAYYVMPFDADGAGSASNTISVALGSAEIPAPVGLYAFPYGTPAIRLVWNVVPGATSYNLYRGTSAGSESSTPLATGLNAGYTGANDRYFDDTTAVAGTTYYYTVSAVNGYGESAKPAEAAATSAGAVLVAPTLTASTASTSILLSWNTVSGATSYTLRRADASGYYTTLATTTSTSYTDSTAIAGVTYSYYVFADSTLGAGRNSNTIMASVNQKTLSAPTGLVAYPNSGVISLYWNAVPGATSYNVYRSTSAGGEGNTPIQTGVGAPSYASSDIVSGLTNGTKYYFEVTAVSAGGQSGKSNEASAVPGGTILSAPTLSVSSTSGQASLTWSSVSGATSYLVLRAVGGGINAAVYVKTVTTTSTTDTGLTNGLNYTYAVIPVGANGDGTASNAVTVLIDGVVPPAPGGVAGYPEGDYNQIIWSPVPGITSYNVYRGTTAGGEGNTPIATNVGSVTGAVYYYNDSNVTAGTTYYYKITAVNSIGESAKSSEVSVLTGGTTLGTPTLTAAYSSSKVNLTWSAVLGATSYNVYRNYAGQGFLRLTNVTGTTYSDSAITSGIPVSYYVCAVSAAGQGANSNAVSLDPGGASLAAPTGLTATRDSNANIALSWNPSLAATSYNVYRSTRSGGEGTVPIAAGIANPTYTDTNFVAGSVYYYQVTALNDFGESSKSNEASIREITSPPAAPVLRGNATGTSVTLSWNAVAGATSYNVYESIGGAATILLTTVSGTTQTDGSLITGLSYSFVVTAVGIGGEGDASNVVTLNIGSATTPAPTGVSAFYVLYSSIVEVTWNAIPGVQIYDLYRGTTPGGEGAVPYSIINASSGNLSVQFQDSNVVQGTTYYYFVTAVAGAGESAHSTEVSATYDLSPLPAPNLSGKAVSGAIVLNWSAVAGATSYDLLRSVGSTSAFVTYQTGLTSLTYTDSAVTSGVSYSYMVCAVNTNGCGTNSNVASLYTSGATLSAPFGLIAQPLNSDVAAITLQWNIVPGATSYTVYRGTTANGEGSTPIATNVPPLYSNTAVGAYTDESLNVATVYYYRVSAVNGSGESSLSNEASAISSNTYLAAPSLSGSYHAGQINLTWTAVSGAASYVLSRIVDGPANPDSRVGSVYKTGLTGTSYADTGISTSPVYQYYIQAVNANGAGPVSNTITVTSSGAVLPAPTGLYVIPTFTSGGSQNPTSLELYWNSIDGASSYHVYRGTSPGGEGATPIGSVSDDYNGSVYQVSYIDSGLTPGQQYYYYVTAVSDTGEGTKSAEITGIPGGYIPSSPTLSATAGNNQVTLTWSASLGATSYVVLRDDPLSYDGYVLTYTAIRTGVTGTTFTDTTVMNGASYFYSVAAQNASGTSPGSAPVFVTPGISAGNPLTAPQLVASAADGSVLLIWTTQPSATSYTIYRSTTSGGENGVPYRQGYISTTPGTTTTFVDESVSNYTAYYYKVAAANDFGVGSQSNEAAATPPNKDTPDFLLIPTPTTLAVAAGTEDAVTIGVKLYNTLASVSLSVSGLPTNVTASFDPAVADGSGSYLDIYAGATAAPGVYTITITGTAGTKTHSTTIILQILPAGSMQTTRKMTVHLWNARGDAKPVATRRVSLLNDVGHLAVSVTLPEAQAWKRDLHLGRVGVRDAAQRQLWLGEYALAHDEQPEQAIAHFAAVSHLVSRLSAHGQTYETACLPTQAAFDRALALFYSGAYAEARDAFHHLLMTKTPMLGLDRRTCSLWWRHSVACAGYHAVRAAMGIPEPPRLDPKCGVAALAACLQGVHLPYDEPRLLAACRVTGEGSTLADLQAAAHKLGIRLHAMDADDRGLVLMPKPAVAFVEHDHFIAVTNADQTGVSYLCSDCGAWPGGNVHLSWKQWHLLEVTRYGVAAIPGSAVDHRIELVDACQQDKIQGRTLQVASVSLRNLLPSVETLTLAAHLHPNFNPTNTLQCGYKPDATHCACQILCPTDGNCHGGGNKGPKFGDPINLATGEMEYAPETDFTVYNPSGPSIVWTRVYNSLRSGIEGGYEYNDYGQGWSQSYNVGVYDTSPGQVGTKYVFLPNGGQNSFTAPTVPSSVSPVVKCSVQPGVAMLVTWNFSPVLTYGYFTITFPNRTEWITTGYANKPQCFLLKQIIDRNGNAITFNYQQSVDSQGWPLLNTITDTAHSRTLLTISRANDGTGNIVSVTDIHGRSVYYHGGYYPTQYVYPGYPQSYQQLDRVSQIVAAHASSKPDRWSHGYSLVTNGEGGYGGGSAGEAVPYMTSITVPSPTGTGTSTATETYNPDTGTIASSTDANGNMHVYTSVDANGQTDPAGAYTRVDYYNASGGIDYSYATGFDSNMSKTGVYTTAPVSPLAQMHALKARRRQFPLLSNSQVLGIGYAQYTYVFSDPNDPYQPSSTTDGNGHTTKATYDQFGNVITAMSARGTLTTDSFVYTNFGLGELTKTVTGTKSPTNFAYFEPSGLLKSVTTPTPGTMGSSSTVTTSFTYDFTSQGTHGLGNLLTFTRPGNTVASSITTTYGYTKDGTYSQAAAVDQPLTAVDQLGHVTHLRYDVQGNVDSITDAIGNLTTRTYNIANQSVTTTYPATEQNGPYQATDTMTYLYPSGPQTKIVTTGEKQALFRETDYSYGPEGELLSLTNGSEPVTYTYNAEYKPASVTDGNGKTTQYFYTTSGFLDTVLYPGYTGTPYPSAGGHDSVTFPAYDPLGNPLVRIDGNNAETDFTYNDPENKLTDARYPSKATIDVHFGYDAYGRRSSMTDGTGSMSDAYDDDDNLTTTITTYTGLAAQTMAYTFNDDGSRKTMSTPAGTFSYTYDAAQRLVSLKNPAAETTKYVYGNNNWPQSITLANGVSTGYTFNSRGFLTDLVSKSSGGAVLSEYGGTTASTEMVYDAAGNLTQVNASIPAVTSDSGATDYTYDSKNQLTKEQSTRDSGYSNNFAYDPAGNPTTFRTEGTNVFNDDNQATAFKNSGGASLGTFTYDGNGNATTYENKTLTYDPENRLTADGTSLTAGYTSTDLRAWKAGSSGAKTYFLYDGAQEIVELTSSGAVAAYNTFGALGLVSRRTGSTSTFYTFDPQGNVAERLSSAGGVTGTDYYDAFGLPAIAHPNDPFGYGAQWGDFTDAETGLVLCTFRYYDPVAGRWLTRDPISYDGGINIYAYVQNGPITWVDPSGAIQWPERNFQGYQDLNESADSLLDILGAAGALKKARDQPCKAAEKLLKELGKQAGTQLGTKGGQLLGAAFGADIGDFLGFVGGGFFFGPFGAVGGSILGTELGNIAGEWIGGELGGLLGDYLGEKAGEDSGEYIDKQIECE